MVFKVRLENDLLTDERERFCSSLLDLFLKSAIMVFKVRFIMILVLFKVRREVFKVRTQY